MLRIQKLCILIIPLLLALPIIAHAQTDDNSTITRLDTDSPEAFEFFEAVGIYDFLRIVADESVSGADQIRLEFFPDLAPEIWESELRQLFDLQRLVTGFEANWNADILGPDARAEILAFYQSEMGQNVVMAEIAARAGMSDPDIAEAAQAAVALAARDNDPRLDRFAAFSAEQGLVDRNVSAMMNAQLLFLTGLSDGGALQPPMPEDVLLTFIAEQRDELQAQAEAWLAAYHLMAYGALSEGAFDAFAAFNRTVEGRALGTAVFGAFDTTFEALQYELGLLAARYAAGDDI